MSDEYYIFEPSKRKRIFEKELEGDHKHYRYGLLMAGVVDVNEIYGRENKAISSSDK